MTEAEVVEFGNRLEWRRWLKEHHSRAKKVWLLIQKVGSTKRGLRYEEAVKEAMCYGWIDGKMRRLNDNEFVQRFTPRRRNSVWSRVNRDRVERLIEEGRMAEAGLKAVEEAKRNGRWDRAYTSREPPTMPDDLLEALREDPEAHGNFVGFPNSARFMYVHWINEAKRPETRARRISRVVERARRNQRPGIDM